jgi:DNA-binding GntR family transcriptional regulator
MDAALERQDLVEISQLDTGFHDRIYQASRHDRLYRSRADLRSQVTLFLISRNTYAVTSRVSDTTLLVRLTDDHLLGAYERLRDAMILGSPNGI